MADNPKNPKETLEKILIESLHSPRPASKATRRRFSCVVEMVEGSIICKISRPDGIVEPGIVEPGSPKEVLVNFSTYQKLRALGESHANRSIQVVINPRMVAGISTIKFKPKR